MPGDKMIRINRLTSHQSTRGNTYITVLAFSTLVAVIGLASLLATRVQRRSAQTARDCAEARLCAQSALELGLLFVQRDPNWRENWDSGTWLEDKPLGGGSLTLAGIDPTDGDLANSEYNPLVLTGSGTKGTACHNTEVTLTAIVEPLEALNTCLHVSGLLKVNGGKQITVVGAPISTNGVLDNEGTIDGDAEAGSVDDTGTITGTLTVPAASKQMPAANVIPDYIAKATVVPFTGTIDRQVLTPTCNPWGPANSDGVYYIDTEGNDLTIKNSRILGTLVISAPSKRVTLDDAVFLRRYRSDYPVLIVDGDATIKIHSCDYLLSEDSCSTNFNPVGAPYLGEWDEDTDDVYPNMVQGLVHIKGELKLQQTARIEGAAICEGPVECADQTTIAHDSTLYTSPPEGYTYVSGMQISPGSYKQTVE